MTLNKEGAASRHLLFYEHCAMCFITVRIYICRNRGTLLLLARPLHCPPVLRGVQEVDPGPAAGEADRPLEAADGRLQAEAVIVVRARGRVHEDRVGDHRRGDHVVRVWQ